MGCRMFPLLVAQEYRLGIALPALCRSSGRLRLPRRQWVERESAVITTAACLKFSWDSHPRRMKPKLFIRGPKILNDLIPASSRLVSSSDHLPYRQGDPQGHDQVPPLPPPPSILTLLQPAHPSGLHMVLTFTGNMAWGTPRGP